jgi:hypothetical protein
LSNPRAGAEITEQRHSGRAPILGVEIARTAEAPRPSVGPISRRVIEVKCLVFQIETQVNDLVIDAVFAEKLAVAS